jgi:hypothetical protein
MWHIAIVRLPEKQTNKIRSMQIVIKQLQVAIATKFRASMSHMNTGSHERAVLFVTAYRVYSVSGG